MPCIFWVQNLIVKLDFILEALFASVEHLDPLLLISINGNLRFLRLEGPALLIVNERLGHSCLLGDWYLLCVNRYIGGT